MIDEAEEIEAGSGLQADICIIGAGAAGITLALQFLQSDLRVILLEAGGLQPEAATQALYAGEVADPLLHSPPDEYRERRFGGATTIWGGRCMPLDPLDFRPRDWIPESGWPIGAETLAPYYPAANALCEAGEPVFDAAQALPGGMRATIPGFAPADFTSDGIERFSCPTDFGGRYGHRLAASASLRVILHANVTEIVTSADGARVTGVQVQTLSGKGFFVAAGQVVLATGGLEVPRLLLASRSTHAAGLGNATDQVGRHYMCHMAGTMGELRLADPGRVHHGYDIAEDGTYIRRRYALTEDAQIAHRVGNAVMRLHHPDIPDPSHHTGPLSAVFLGAGLLRREYRKRLQGEGVGSPANILAHGLNLLRDPVATLRFGAFMLWARTLADRKFPSLIVAPKSGVYRIDFHGEQEPNPDSRVTLGTDRDALGMPRLRVDWRYTESDIRTAEVTLGLFSDALSAWGGGALTFAPGEIRHALLKEGAYGGHHLGTARMGASPASSVTDGDGRVHGLHNLYVVGGALFPTSGQANPTLTIVALALRLARHLQRQAARPLQVAAA